MTQQSLITRLKAVEEALAIAQDDVISFADDETNPEVRENLLRDVKRAEAVILAAAEQQAAKEKQS